MDINQEYQWQEEESKQYGLLWCYTYDPPIKRTTKLIIKKTIKKDIKYLNANGECLRKDTFKDLLEKPDIMVNLEQIRFLQWQGNYGENMKKINKWTALWNGETLSDVGGLYSQDGKKQGKWKELYKNYWKKAQVYEIGEYKNDQRIGTWKYLMQKVEIGGGEYDDQGQKTLKWVEPSDNFWIYGMITYFGEYKNGQKIGLWDTYWKLGINYYQIGGGIFDQQSNQKNGRWIEITDGYWKKFNQITYQGKYANGKKIGKWDSFYREYQKNSYDQIGGGWFDNNNQKIGLWIELSDGFTKGSNVTYIGNYKNDQKIGIWKIVYQQCYGELKKIQIGGGQYENESNLKNGKWIELSSEFSGFGSQVTYNGEYKRGKKVGLWDIFYRDHSIGEYQLIGCGLYNEEQNEKNGIWNELIEGFDYCRQGICIGQYLNGKRIGQWNTFYRENQSAPFEKIGGGQYESQSNLKTGEWIDLSDGFYCASQITYKGFYKKGKKVGVWDTYFKIYEENSIEHMYFNIQLFNVSNLIIRGGGQYDGKSNTKNGKWIDVIDEFWHQNQTIYKGEYKDGKKIGKWQEMNRHFINNQGFIQTGEKLY